MYYIHTANPLERTARWFERRDGGLEELKAILIEDSLGIGESLEKDMAALVASYHCEWKEAVDNPERLRHFTHFSNDLEADPAIRFIDDRGQRRPADWEEEEVQDSMSGAAIPEDEWSWIPLGPVGQIPRDSGRAMKVPSGQIAVFHHALEDRFYATENQCPHQKDMVLARGLLGSENGEPKVACPLHKKTFSLQTGKGISDPSFCVPTFPVEVRKGELFVKMPPTASIEASKESGS